MSELLIKIKEFIVKYKWIFASILIFLFLMIINRMVWNPTLKKEKRALDQQSKNEEMLREREESKLQITDTGVYFLPRGKKNIDSQKGGTKTKAATSGKKRKEESSISPINDEIGKKISFLYNRLNQISRNDTEEFAYTDKEIFKPFYEMEKKEEQRKEVIYRPDYVLKDIEYLGFFQRGDKRTAIVRYTNGLNYISKGQFLAESSLSVHMIEKEHMIFKDNKTGEDIQINKR